MMSLHFQVSHKPQLNLFSKTAVLTCFHNMQWLQFLAPHNLKEQIPLLVLNLGEHKSATLAPVWWAWVPPSLRKWSLRYLGALLLCILWTTLSCSCMALSFKGNHPSCWNCCLPVCALGFKSNTTLNYEHNAKRKSAGLMYARRAKGWYCRLAVRGFL